VLLVFPLLVIELISQFQDFAVFLHIDRQSLLAIVFELTRQLRIFLLSPLELLLQLLNLVFFDIEFQSHFVILAIQLSF